MKMDKEPKKLKVGDMIKVCLPGESPFAEVVSLLPNGLWIGRVDNHLVATDSDLRLAIASDWGKNVPIPQLHDSRQDDLILFSWQQYGDYGWCWQPVGYSYSG